MSMTAYADAWLQHLHSEYLHGTFYLDRYYIESFARNLNQFYGETLRPHLIVLVRRHPINDPVPVNFRPERLLAYLTYVSSHVGIKTLSLVDTPREIAGGQRRNPSSSSSSTQRTRSTNGSRERSVRQIEAPPDEDEGVSLVAQMDSLDFLSPEELSLVFQVSAAYAGQNRHCDLCNKPGHLLAQCPELPKVRGNPSRCRRLFTMLRGIWNGLQATQSAPMNNSATSGSASPSAGGGAQPRGGTPTRDNRATPIRQVARDDDTDDDTVLGDDERSLGSTDTEKEDF